MSAGVPEEHRLIPREALLPHVGDQTGHGFGGVRRIQKDAVGARGQLERFLDAAVGMP